MDLAIALDVETTGFGYKKSDRIVEIAGVVFNLHNGEVVAVFDTLINPQRNIPASSTKIHGLQAAHLSMAPTFDELAPWLAYTLSGKTVIAHNALFDVNFINAEFVRSSIDFQITEYLCTCRLSKNASLKSAAIELDLDYDPDRHHGALYDAQLCREIFTNIHKNASGKLHLKANPEFQIARQINLPSLVTRVHLGLEPAVRNPGVNLALSVFEFRENPAEACYLWRLSEHLSDLEITSEEMEDLNTLAESLGLSDDVQKELHDTYIRQLEKAAMRDGLISQNEMQLLESFSKALGVNIQLQNSEPSEFIPGKGSLICVTGTANIGGKYWGKSEIENWLSLHSFVFTDVLNKSDGVALLLQESEGSQSSKVVKAIKWGIPRMTIEKFINLIETVE